MFCKKCGYEEQTNKTLCTLCGTSFGEVMTVGERPSDKIRNTLSLRAVESSQADLHLTLHIGEIKLVMPFPVGFELRLGRGDDVKTVTLVEPVHNLYPRQGGELHIVENITNFLHLSPFGGEKAGVSRRHALLCRTESGFQIEDLGSTNGTRVNSERLHPGKRQAVRSGDIVSLGLMSMKLVSVHDPHEIYEAQHRQNRERNKPAS